MSSRAGTTRQLTGATHHEERPLGLRMPLRQPRPNVLHVTSGPVMPAIVTPLERTLAVRLGMPIDACDAAVAHPGTRSGSREAFRRAGVALPSWFERLRDAQHVVAALAEPKRGDPTVRRAVVNLGEGLSSEGNAAVSYDGAPHVGGLARRARAAQPALA